MKNMSVDMRKARKHKGGESDLHLIVQAVSACL